MDGSGVFCVFLCLYKPCLNRVDSRHNEFGTMDLAGINFDDGAGNDDDALDASPRRQQRRRGGGLNNYEIRMRNEMERQLLLAWISPKKVDLSSLSTLDQGHLESRFKDWVADRQLAQWPDLKGVQSSIFGLVLLKLKPYIPQANQALVYQSPEERLQSLSMHKHLNDVLLCFAF